MDGEIRREIAKVFTERFAWQFSELIEISRSFLAAEGSRKKLFSFKIALHIFSLLSGETSLFSHLAKSKLKPKWKSETECALSHRLGVSSEVALKVVG